MEKAIDEAVAANSLDQRQLIIKEWRNWNNVEGLKNDPRPAINDGLGVNVYFSEPIEGRDFMNTVYDKLIISIRTETRNWGRG